MPTVAIRYVKGRKSPWKVRYFRNRKELPKFFAGDKTSSIDPWNPPKAAVKYQKAIERELKEYGAAATNLSMEARMQLIDAKEILEGSGMSVVDAVKRGLESRKKTPEQTQGLPLAEAIKPFLHYCKNIKKLRLRTCLYYEVNLDTFARRFPNARITDFARVDLKRYIQSLEPSTESKLNHWRAIRRLFNWCLSEDPPLIQANITTGIDFQLPKIYRVIKIIEVEHAETLMKNADARIRDGLALMFFAGIRPGEIRDVGKPPLDWRDIDIKTRTIEISPEVSKTGKYRLIQNTPDNLWDWLKLKPKESGPVTGHGFHEEFKRLRMKSKIGKWVQDGCRKSFVSYHASYFQNLALTSEIVGHEEEISTIKKFYLKPRLRESGEKYFAIKP